MKLYSRLHLLGPLAGAEGTCQRCQAESLAVALRKVAITAAAEWRDEYTGSYRSSTLPGNTKIGDARKHQ